MPLAIRALSLELINLVAKNPKGRGGTSLGKLQRMGEQDTLTRKPQYRKYPSTAGKARGPKPITIRAEQEDK